MPAAHFSYGVRVDMFGVSCYVGTAGGGALNNHSGLLGALLICKQGEAIMGDKGKKDKEKGQKQKSTKHEQVTKAKEDKQPKRKP